VLFARTEVEMSSWRGVPPYPTPCFLAKSSDLLEKRQLSENRETGNCTRVRKLLIMNGMVKILRALECERCELFAKSSDVIENK
jgi:hypothetical protein